MIPGSCLCGTIRFEIDEAEILLFNLCHCTSCQKRSGTAHTSQIQVAGDGFRWLRGENHISLYKTDEVIRCSFCSICGCRLPSSRNWDEIVAIPAGLLEADPGIKPEINIHAENSPSWHKLDRKITTIEGQGSDEFWSKFMQGKRSD